MAKELTSLADSIGGLSLADGTTQLSSLAPTHPTPNQVALLEAIRALTQSIQAAATHAQHVDSLAEGTDTLRDQDVTFNHAVERSIVDYITTLARPGTVPRRLLSHFDETLRKIVRDVLDNNIDDDSVLREILEACYDQALRSSGSLHADKYFIPLAEARLASPYDPDFESEEYYEHENRLAVDEAYASTFRVECQRKAERETEQKRQQTCEWVGFWVQALQKCPDGPTLFYPPGGRQPQCQLADVPRYLFRVFDDRSSGRSDENVVASMESLSALPHNSKFDILSRTQEEAIEMLYGHLTKPCFKWENDADNLMSWSSSLLFVVQYAIWRCYQRDMKPDEVKVCMVDTRKFPRGQFARDLSLIRTYGQNPELDDEMRDFFDFRLRDARYDNGEYLSQGVLHHTERSAVVSLAQLIQSGLYDLFPEFQDPAGRKSWANRVKDLRLEWSVQRTTTQLDIQRALRMARACFRIFNAPEVALLLLSFKARKLQVTMTAGLSGAQEFRGNFNDYGPSEVRRYMKIIQTMVLRERNGFDTSCWLASADCWLLEKVFAQS